MKLSGMVLALHTQGPGLNSLSTEEKKDNHNYRLGMWHSGDNLCQACKGPWV